MNAFLKIENVTKDFMGLRALNNVSFDVSEGEIHALIGPNGSGKSTLFNVVTGVYPITSGNFSLQGESLVGMKPSALAKKGIARTFQNIKLFNELSVEDNIKIGVAINYPVSYIDIVLNTHKNKMYEKEIQEKTDYILDIIGLQEYKKEKACNLSYGRQRVLEIGRAWGTEPKLLLLDEPGAGMNDKEKDILVNLIYTLNNNNITVIIVEHDMKLVMNIAKLITVLDSGTKIAEGTPKEISSNPKVIEAYLGKEAKHAEC